MRSPVNFRNEAAQCLRLAEQTKAPRYRALLMDLAQAWALLEEQARDIRDVGLDSHVRHSAFVN